VQDIEGVLEKRKKRGGEGEREVLPGYASKEVEWLRAKGRWMNVQGDSSFTARAKTHTSNRFKFLKKIQEWLCDAVEHSVNISNFLMKRVNISF
jgi:hypothetical protein